jgi:hypothetical protein
MKYAVGCLTMAAALVGGPAQAVQFGGESTWAFSTELNQALRIGPRTFSAIAPGEVDTSIVVPFSYGHEVLMTAPVSNVVYGASYDVSAIHTSGGMTITYGYAPYISRGGSIDITDLSIDLNSKRVYATLRGDFSGAVLQQAGQGDPNRVETIENFHLFNYQTLLGSTTLTLSGETNFEVSGLTITSSGLGHLISALRLTTFGPAALRSVTNYGFITTSISAVPEPSTYAMALVGGALVMVAKRARRPARQA